MTGSTPLHSPLRLVFAALIGLTGCASQQAPDQAAATAAINDIWKEYSASLNARQADRSWKIHRDIFNANVAAGK